MALLCAKLLREMAAPREDTAAVLHRTVVPASKQCVRFIITPSSPRSTPGCWLLTAHPAHPTADQGSPWCTHRRSRAVSHALRVHGALSEHSLDTTPALPNAHNGRNHIGRKVNAQPVLGLLHPGVVAA